nr:MAG: protease polymerase P70 [Chemarfal virus 200]
MRMAASNSKLLAVGAGFITDLAVDRLYNLLHCDDVTSLSAEQLVLRNLADPVRVFVKNELHGRRKVAEGRHRLIMSISLVDQLVERVLNSAQNRAEIGAWERCASKPGMGLHDEGLASLRRTFEAFKTPTSSDISGFDWSVDWWALRLDAKIRADLSRVSELALVNRAWCLAMSLIVFSDGVMWAQWLPGIQKSGSYNTSSTNSRIRVALAVLVALRAGRPVESLVGLVMAMGDDAVEDCPSLEGFVEAYQALGFELKEVSQSPIEFCAYSYTPNTHAPVRWHKMLATLLRDVPATQSHADTLLEAFSYEMRHSPMLQESLAIIAAVGWGPRQNNGENTQIA